MKPDVYVAIATIVVFLGLLLVLRKLAWGPMLEGLKKREESILSAVEEAKKAREETQRVTAEFKAKMDQAYAEIPKIMEEARREAEAFKEETRAQTAKEMQAERQRLRREIDTAKDQALQELWTQAAQLATLISAKVIGRSLPAAEHHRLIDEALVELREAAPRR
ncbi:MAG: F0F1 ATP synthase subunit B [Planctomycetes bacterium]|nr:F0F1 ATP synthase subunit B [Planctomycetota bacterium]